MLKLFFRFFICAAALIACACSGPDHITIKGTVEGAPDINITLRYYNADAIQTMVTAVRKGEFEVKAPLSQPAVVEIADGNGSPMATIYAVPGDEIKCHLTRGNEFAMQATGNAVTEAWCAFANPRADLLLHGADNEINAEVEKFIADHRADKVAAMAFRLYNAALSPARADSVRASIDTEAQDPHILSSYLASAFAFADSAAFAPFQPFVARTYHKWTTDSTITVRPATTGITVFIFSADRVVEHLDSVRPALRDFAKRRGVTAIDISLASDTFIWKRIAQRDTATWAQAWLPGGTLAEGPHRLAIPCLPYVIITDSTGTQLLRTPSITAATKFQK